MALTRKRRQELALMLLPSDNDMQQRVRTFLMRSGLSASELAEQIGYAASSVGLFLSNRYNEHHPAAENTANMKAALKVYIDRHEFTHSPRLLGEHIETEDFLAVRASALKALQNGTAYIVDGPPGTQKTRTFLEVMDEIRARQLGEVFYIYCRVEHTKQSFLQELCAIAGVPNNGSIDKLIRKLRFFLAAHPRVLFLVDEGQHLSMSALEILRQLIDTPPFFGVVIGGSHDLTQRLQHWQMEQWRQRVQKIHELRGPSRTEARQILASQLGINDRDVSDQIINDCKAFATRFDGSRRRKYEYTSALLLFGFIEGSLTAQPRKEPIAA